MIHSLINLKIINWSAGLKKAKEGQHGRASEDVHILNRIKVKTTVRAIICYVLYFLTKFKKKDNY